MVGLSEALCVVGVRFVIGDAEGSKLDVAMSSNIEVPSEDDFTW